MEVRAFPRKNICANKSRVLEFISHINGPAWCIYLNLQSNSFQRFVRHWCTVHESGVLTSSWMQNIRLLIFHIQERNCQKFIPKISRELTAYIFWFIDNILVKICLFLIFLNTSNDILWYSYWNFNTFTKIFQCIYEKIYLICICVDVKSWSIECH